MALRDLWPYEFPSGPKRARPSATCLTSTFGPMTDLLNAQPLAALVIGIVVLIFPRILNYAIAAYLIFVGVTGLWPNLMAPA